MYCTSWAKFMANKDKPTTVTATKTGAVYLNPEVGQCNKAIEFIRKFGAVLGLSPSDRVGLGAKADDQSAMDKAYFA